MFKCRACAAKDQSIALLREEIAFLRTLVHPPVNNSHIPDDNQEANGLLDVLDRPIEILTHADETQRLTEEDQRERQALLSGEY